MTIIWNYLNIISLLTFKYILLFVISLPNQIFHLQKRPCITFSFLHPTLHFSMFVLLPYMDCELFVFTVTACTLCLQDTTVERWISIAPVAIDFHLFVMVYNYLMLMFLMVSIGVSSISCCILKYIPYFLVTPGMLAIYMGCDTFIQQTVKQWIEDKEKAVVYRVFL